MKNILKYLTIIPGAAMLLFSIYIMGVAQDANMNDSVSIVIKVVIYTVSIIFVFLSISVILYALSYINGEKTETGRNLKQKSIILNQKIYLVAEIFAYSFWTFFILIMTIFGWKSIKGDILIIMIFFWISALYSLYRLIKIIIKKRK